MILAAGLGTRLKPITDHKPKALVEIGGMPMLERVILLMKRQGVDYIVINVHHFYEQILEFLSKRDYGIEIKISEEIDELLDTGGGIVKAKKLLFKKDDNPVLIHNVDILSNAELTNVMSAFEKETTLLINDRDSSRKLIFDKYMNLKGWHDLKNEKKRCLSKIDKIDESLGLKEFAFSGIYKMTRASIEEMEDLMGKGKFSVMDYFLHLKRKENIIGLKEDHLEIIDIGKPATLQQASQLYK